MPTRKEFNMPKIRRGEWRKYATKKEENIHDLLYIFFIIGEIVVLCVGGYLLMQEDVRIALFYWFMLIYMKQRSLED